MLRATIASIDRQNHGLLGTIYVGVLLLVGVSTVTADIPLPRPRPPEIPTDQLPPQLSLCEQRLTEVAVFKRLSPITGPGECIASDVVSLDSVVLPDQSHVALSPPPTLRCPMAEAVAHWLRDDVAPAIGTLRTSLQGVETLDSFVCRGRNGASGGKISEHGHANALDVRALKLADRRSIVLTDEKVDKSLRENLRQSACARFTTVLGNGADAYHDSHVHLDLIERSNKYRICQWDVLDVADTAALAAKKTVSAANPPPERDIPLPRPRPQVKGDLSAKLPQRRYQHIGETRRRAVFDLMAPSPELQPLAPCLLSEATFLPARQSTLRPERD
jgi:Extensin-like protein C-terminus